MDHKDTTVIEARKLTGYVNGSSWFNSGRSLPCEQLATDERNPKGVDRYKVSTVTLQLTSKCTAPAEYCTGYPISEATPPRQRNEKERPALQSKAMERTRGERKGEREREREASYEEDEGRRENIGPPAAGTTKLGCRGRAQRRGWRVGATPTSGTAGPVPIHIRPPPTARGKRGERERDPRDAGATPRSA